MKSKIQQLKLDVASQLTSDDTEIVFLLITYHAMADSYLPSDCDDRTVLLWKIIKDADALDRIRFDDLNIKYLRLPESKGLIQLAHELIFH